MAETELPAGRGTGWAAIPFDRLAYRYAQVEAVRSCAFDGRIPPGFYAFVIWPGHEEPLSFEERIRRCGNSWSRLIEFLRRDDPTLSKLPLYTPGVLP